MKRTRRLLAVAALVIVALLLGRQRDCRREPPAHAAVCGGQRWVGRVAADSECPAATDKGWTVGSPFHSAKLPVALKGYCLYEWHGDGPPALAGLPAAHRLLSKLDEDCAIVVGQAPASCHDGLASQLRDRFAQGIDTPAMPPPVGNQPVRVAIVDTWPDAVGAAIDGAPGISEHGYTLHTIIRDIACPAPPGPPAPTCGSLVSATRLALGLPAPVPAAPNPQGGFFGTPLQLADAIRGAVDDWVAVAAAQPHLIINLSVGWDPSALSCDYADVNWSTLSPDAQAVQGAILYAACNGVLVIAAAGNLAGGPGPSGGAVCPARFETNPLPTLIQCQTELGAAFVSSYPATNASYKPLLHAVGGVDHDGVQIALSRPLGRPRLAAIAHLGTGHPRSGRPWPVALTGTSVSAAVVSGIAAAVWVRSPTLAAPEVAQLIHDSAAPLSPSATAGFGFSAITPPQLQPIRRASLQSALAPSPAPPHFPPSQDVFTSSSIILPLLSPPPVPLRLNQITPPSACSPQPAQWFSPPGFNPAYPCPFQQLPIGLLPAVRPQPGFGRCGLCFIKQSGVLVLDYDPTPGSGVSDLTMTLLDANNAPLQAVSLGVLQGGSATGITPSGTCVTDGNFVSLDVGALPIGGGSSQVHSVAITGSVTTSFGTQSFLDQILLIP